MMTALVIGFEEDKNVLEKENYIQGQQYTAAREILPRSDNGEPLVYVNSVPSIDQSTMYDGYRWGKFEYAIGSTNRLSNDFPLLRYADVLFMKAEALMRSGQPGAGALVTQIRERDFKDNPAKATVTDEDLEGGSAYDYGRRDSYETTYEGGADIQYGRFLDELGWEFCQEGRRRQDLIRFGVFTTKSWFSHDASSSHKILYPIPNQALLTNSNLTQTPGY
ncbi:RagB/SusD family nutrient uptake outer membrane protein [Mangrovibacterium sp.]|uniref:RagB/SusD family nutrient uptake outer membrane protein n=1 Tax=Mangrovibacterium sp. TaxID=1961364 RepID=UPI0035672CC5